ncbi:hypothetical protein V8C42DRAFT_153811 [Trichoderma barbatum]
MCLPCTRKPFSTGSHGLFFTLALRLNVYLRFVGRLDDWMILWASMASGEYGFSLSCLFLLFIFFSTLSCFLFPPFSSFLLSSSVTSFCHILLLFKSYSPAVSGCIRTHLSLRVCRFGNLAAAG